MFILLSEPQLDCHQIATVFFSTVLFPHFCVKHVYPSFGVIATEHKGEDTGFVAFKE